MSNPNNSVPTENGATARMLPESNDSETGSNEGGEFGLEAVPYQDQGSGGVVEVAPGVMSALVDGFQGLGIAAENVESVEKEKGESEIEAGFGEAVSGEESNAEVEAIDLQRLEHERRAVYHELRVLQRRFESELEHQERLSASGKVGDGSAEYGFHSFANHSCDPSCIAVPDATAVGADGVAIRALRDLVSGEEVTHDYGLWASPVQPRRKCKCGTAKCRGFLEREAAGFAIDDAEEMERAREADDGEGGWRPGMAAAEVMAGRARREMERAMDAGVRDGSQEERDATVALLKSLGVTMQGSDAGDYTVSTTSSSEYTGSSSSSLSSSSSGTSYSAKRMRRRERELRQLEKAERKKMKEAREREREV